MREAYNAKDFEAVYKCAHKIKPSLDDMGIVILHDKIRDIEKAAMEGKDLPGLATKIDFFLTTLGKVNEQIKEEI